MDEPGGAADGRPALTVGAISSPLRAVDAATSCADVDELFRADPGLHCLLVVEDDGAGASSATGLVSRSAFLTTMSGRYGYGRSLHARRPVRVLCEEEPLVVEASSSVSSAADLLLARSTQHRFSDVLVRCEDGGLRLVRAERVFRELSAQLAVAALVDPLTGLANRAQFLARLEEVCAGRDRARWGDGAAVVFVDLDGFKSVNDGFGHAAGDQVLRLTAQRLRALARPGDVVARLGGDEFAVLVPGASADRARTLAAALCAGLSRPLDVGARELPGRASVGVAVCARTPVPPSTLLHEADLAMYRAKTSGGRRWELADTSGLGPAPGAPDRRTLEAAMAGGEVVVHYQPVVEVGSGRLRAVEALVRWQHPARGLLSPAEFLDAVAATGLAAELDAHVLRTALAQQAAWVAEHGPQAPGSVAVNLSVDGLLHPQLVSTVLGELARAALPPRSLCLELPEVATSAQVRAAAQSLAALRATGVQVVLDDVGSGAAGLSHLADLRLDGVKIDRRYVSAALDDERDAAVVRLLVEMAHGLGIAVIAEGAETAAHLEALRELARDRPVLVQGWATGRPTPARDVPLPWVPAPRAAHDGGGPSAALSR